VPAPAFGLAAERDLPRPLDVEIPRLRLTQRLGRRWDRAVTLVVAGPGFGKTTALAQAVRANLLAPRGVDAWVTCDPGHEDPVRLARALLAALAPQPGRGDHARAPASPGAREVVEALIRWAPLDVCLLLDDVHEIPAGSPGAALLGEVVAALPATAHLVLAGRLAPDLPLARREAAGQVTRINGEDLVFTGAETAALARRLGRDASVAGALEGWPALVRLAFAAGPGAPWRYAREEVLSRLPDPHLRALGALATLGTGTAGEVAAVAGQPVSLDDLARRIPLVAVLDDGRYRAHDLWTATVARAMTPQQARQLRERAAELLAARGDLARAGRLACQAEDWPLLGRLAVGLVGTTLSALPRATAERWLGAVPPPVAGTPPFLLLRAAVLHARDFADPGIDALADAAWRGLLGGGDADGAAVALGQAVISAHSRADHRRLGALAARTDDLGAVSSPVLRLLRHSVAGVLAEVGGDPEAALAEFARAPVAEVPPDLAFSTLRFHVHCLDMCGRGAEAAELADRALGGAADEHAQLAGPLARWFDGDPADLGRLRETARTVLAAAARSPAAMAGHPGAGTARDAFVTTALVAVAAASWGDGPGWPALPCGDPDDHHNPRDAALACGALAAVAVARGDEAAARAAYARLLDRWPVQERLAERHLRRFLALGYVLDARLRARWDAADLGPSHVAARAAARALLRARAGDLTAAAGLAPRHGLCFLPLPWSAELAARLAAAGDPRGYELGGWLTDAVGPAVHRQLRADAPDAAGAVRLLAVLPAPPSHRLGIEVLGPLRIVRDGVPADPPELRRVRVRQLLSVLVLRPVLGRTQAMELLWPGLDPEKAARNLRVTLTHLRRLLEPDRSAGDASYHLRAGGDTIRLVRSGSLSADLWTLEQLEARVAEARSAGDTDRAAELLGAAVALWRDEPLPDLTGLPDLDAAADADLIRARHVRALLALGELRLVAGAAGDAFRLADRALLLEPFDARGHRLLLAAALRCEDPARITAARRRVLGALRQLGTGPDPATAVLLRQAPPPARAGSRAT
jgi:DNA-binding SARP family transcriptional activator